jgi:hypothetical protein
VDSGVVIADIIDQIQLLDVREKVEKVGKSWQTAHSKTRFQPKPEAGFNPIGKIGALTFFDEPS